MKLRTVVSTSKTVKKYSDWKRDISILEYRPFLTVRDVNKVGRRHWIYCPKQKRLAHLLSDGEKRFYMVVLYNRLTVALYEQYALDIDETLNIATELNFIHPRNWESNEAYVMTTDFVRDSLVPDQPSKIQTTAYTFKYWDQIYIRLPDGSIEKKNMRTWQKFAIEREYWGRRGIEYRVVTEQDATKAQLWNIQYCKSSSELEIAEDELFKYLTVFGELWEKSPWLQLQELAALCCSRLCIAQQHSIALFKYCVLYGFLLVNPNVHLRLFRPVELISIELEAL